MNDTLSGDQSLVFYGTISTFQNVDCLPFLSEEEITRAQQYLLPFDKSRYLISRVILKRLLSRFLNMDEQEIQFRYGKNGKPFLFGNSDLQFNISHSGDAFVMGFTLEKEIGIDVESLQRIPNISALESFLFTPAELKSFQRLNQNLQPEAFISSWTRKEALLKASGDGLTKAMNTLDLSSIKDKHFSIETANEFPENKTDWFLESYSLMDNYRGAVAVKGGIDAIQYIPINESILEFN